MLTTITLLACARGCRRQVDRAAVANVGSWHVSDLGRYPT